ncbi:hypothetical protein [Nocardia sp. NPDC057440]|uniref:hypothetical protein n=1 Tax=Nocardia sp. NPDC057440 TaxID=3346134 RepID=UPI00366C147D
MSIQSAAWRAYLADLRATDAVSVDHHIGTALAALSAFAGEAAVLNFLITLVDEDRGTAPSVIASQGLRALHAVEAQRCSICMGVNGNHSTVHTRHGNGGGSNILCPNAETAVQS